MWPAVPTTKFISDFRFQISDCSILLLLLAPPRVLAQPLLPAASLFGCALALIFLGSRRAPRRPARSIVPADMFEHVFKPEFDLPPLHVDLDDLHPHRVAKAVQLPGVLAK